jgi:hypothetical protein
MTFPALLEEKKSIQCKIDHNIISALFSASCSYRKKEKLSLSLWNLEGTKCFKKVFMLKIIWIYCLDVFKIENTTSAVFISMYKLLSSQL